MEYTEMGYVLYLFSGDGRRWHHTYFTPFTVTLTHCCGIYYVERIRLSVQRRFST